MDPRAGKTEDANAAAGYFPLFNVPALYSPNFVGYRGKLQPPILPPAREPHFSILSIYIYIYIPGKTKRESTKGFSSSSRIKAGITWLIRFENNWNDHVASGEIIEDISRVSCSLNYFIFYPLHVVFYSSRKKDRS